MAQSQTTTDQLFHVSFKCDFAAKLNPFKSNLLENESKTSGINENEKYLLDVTNLEVGLTSVLRVDPKVFYSATFEPLSKKKYNIAFFVKCDPKKLDTLRDYATSKDISGISDVQIEPQTEKPLSPPDKPNFDSNNEFFNKLFENSKPLEKVEFKGRVGERSFNAEFSPFYKEINFFLYVKIEFSWPKKDIDEILFSAQVYDKTSSNGNKARDLYGLKFYNNKTTLTHNLSGNINLGIQGKDPTLGATLGYSKASQFVEDDLTEILTQDLPYEYAARYSKNEHFKDQLIQRSLIFHWTFDSPLDEITVKNLQLRANIVSTVKQHLRKDKHKRSIFTYDFNRDFKPLAFQDVIIGGVVGYPKSGKTSLVDVLFQVTHIKPEKNLSFNDTPYLQKHKFKNVCYGKDKDGKEKYGNFSFLDTRGFYFHVPNPEDTNSSNINNNDPNNNLQALNTNLQILKRFIQGLPEGTDFSKKIPLPTEIRTENAPTHLILTVSARDLYKGIKWEHPIKKYLEFFIPTTWTDAYLKSISGTINIERIQAMSYLYHTMVKLLADSAYSGDKEKAGDNVVLIITHTDMLTNNDKVPKTILGDIRSAFTRLDVLRSVIYFGGKECEWDEQILLDHEKRVNDLLSGLPDNEDYWDYLKKKLNANKEDSHNLIEVLHISPDKCKKGAQCKHRFTEETIKTYAEILNNFLE